MVLANPQAVLVIVKWENHIAYFQYLTSSTDFLRKCRTHPYQTDQNLKGKMTPGLNGVKKG